MRIRVSRRSKRSKQWSSLCGSGSRTDAINFLWCRLGQAVLPHSRAQQEHKPEGGREGERESEAVQGRQSCMAECTSKAVCSGQRQRTEAQAESFNRPQQTCNFIRMSVETARDRVTEQCRTLKKTKRVVLEVAVCVLLPACLPVRGAWDRGEESEAGRQAVRTLSGA